MLGRLMLGVPEFGTIASVLGLVERGSRFGFQRGAKSESAGARSGLNMLPSNAGGEASFNDADSWVGFANGLIDDGTLPDRKLVDGDWI